MPLVLTADKDNEILIDTGHGVVRLWLGKVLDFKKVRLVIDAPRSILIWREDRCDAPPRSETPSIPSLLRPDSPKTPTSSS